MTAKWHSQGLYSVNEPPKKNYSLKQNIRTNSKKTLYLKEELF